MTDFLWTVDKYCDRMRARKAAAVRKEQIEAEKWRRKMNVFETEQAAREFMLNRALVGIGKAQDALARAKRRLAKLKKKLWSSAPK
jgi:hypothetical protein